MDDISHGLAAGRFRVATLQSGVLYVLGVTQMGLTRIVREPSRALAVSLAQQMCAMLLSGLRVPDTDADLIAAQASDEIVRSGYMRRPSPLAGKRSRLHDRDDLDGAPVLERPAAA